MGARISVDALKKTKIPSLSRNEQKFAFDWTSVHEPNEIKKLYMIHFIKLCSGITPCTAHFLVLTCSRNTDICSKNLI
jgi:hypothetical protein